MLVERTFAPVVASIRAQLPLDWITSSWSMTAPTGVGFRALAYEDLLAAQSPTRRIRRPVGRRRLHRLHRRDHRQTQRGALASGGHLLRHHDSRGRGDRARRGRRQRHAPVHPRLQPLADQGVAVPDIFVSYALGPLMHVSGHWSAWGAMLSGGRTVLHPGRSMDADTVLRTVADEQATMLTIVGDSMGRPIVDAIEQGPAGYDTNSVLMLGSGGSIMSTDVKDRLFAGFPSAMVLTEAIGSSESPAQAIALTVRGQPAGPALRFRADDRTTVFDEDLRPVAPGSGEVGRLATKGRVPVGYFHDPEKSASTFVTVDGVRWALPGDMATIGRDGTIHLLGRGTLCINTGGEKVYPEEVEAV